MWALLVFICMPGVRVFAQNTYVPLGSVEYSVLERNMVLTGDYGELHSSIKPFRRSDVVGLAAQFLHTRPSPITQAQMVRILQNNNEFVKVLQDSIAANPDQVQYLDSSKTFVVIARPQVEALDLTSRKPFLKHFYKTPAHFYEINKKDFYLKVNPLIHFGFGNEQNDDDPLFINRRGIEIRGGIDQKVFFASDIVETQLRPPSHIQRWVLENKVFPDAGLFKQYRSSFFDFDNAYDYLNSSGYLGFNISRHVGLHLGHGKNFIGEGYRSLLLSDFAKNYFYLKLNTRVWKLHYQNIFAELSAGERESNVAVFPKKYLAAHYLNFYIRPNFSVGLYEAVIFAREDDRFELQYLNPVILYRTIEQHVGSPDNVLLGMNFRWDVFKRASIYGQLMFDEFKVGEFFSSDQWWGNKYGIQLGAKYFNALNVENLDVQLEYNRVRPFTYSHRDSVGSYAHFNQALAHPSGANFTEIIAIARYQPIDKLEVTLRVFLVDTAEDTDDTYFGTSILRPNGTRNAEYGVVQGQGVAVDNTMLSFQARYRLKHNFFLEAEYFRRDYAAAEPTSDLLTQYVSLGLRWNLFYSRPEY